MPSTHRIALKKVLDGIGAQIAKDEARLLTASDDEERAKLIDEIADLKVRWQEVLDALSGDGDH
jgi:hypothetical protein